MFVGSDTVYVQLEECNGFPRLSRHDLQLLSDTKRLFVLDSRAPIKIHQQTGGACTEGSYLFSAHAVMWLHAIRITCSTSTPITLSSLSFFPSPLFTHVQPFPSPSSITFLTPPSLAISKRSVSIRPYHFCHGKCRSHPSSAPSGGRVHSAAKRVGAYWVG